MKKPKKSMIILFSILAVIGITIGGWSMHQYQQKQEMIAIATSDEAKNVYESHMKALDQNALTDDGVIKSYEIDNESLYYNPMGGMEVTVYVNHDKDLEFQFGIIKDNEGILKSSGYIYSGKLAKLLGEQGYGKRICQ